MPQGAAYFPAWFVSVMRLVTDGLDNIRMYLDDATVSDDSPMTHVATLAPFFARLRLHNLNLSPDKSQIGAASVDFLEHVISQDGVRPNDDKIAALAQMPMPRDINNFAAYSEVSAVTGSFYPTWPNACAQSRPYSNKVPRSTSLPSPYGSGRLRPTRRIRSPTNTHLSRLGRCYRQVSTISLTL